MLGQSITIVTKMATHDDASLFSARVSSWFVKLGHISVEKKGKFV
jgi:hypothetical protein